MKSLYRPDILGPVISGVLTFFAICHINFIFSWICYVPVFITIYNKQPREIFKPAFLYGLTFSSFAFFWMIPGAQRFTGYSLWYGAGVFFISAAFFSLFIGALLYIFLLLRKRDEQPHSFLINTFLAGSVFCIAESLLMTVSSGFPWFDVHSGNGLAENIYAIQPAAFFGIHIMTFAVVAVNYLIATLIFKKQWQKLYIPLLVFIIYLSAGFFILKHFETNLPETKPFSVAIVSENILPDIAWDDNTGNELVNKLLVLSQSLVTLKPDIALWSESAIPWTYNKDDDLVKEIFKITDPSHITHILGINTAFKQNEVFNSAYCILPGANVSCRYDKQFLLSFIEKPLNGWIMPFFSSKGFSAINDGRHNAPLNTPYGKAGILLCNEAAIPAAATNMVTEGAEFLMNMSNDGWFNDTYIVHLHFCYARLRAVETRKDIAVNCNNGYSGLIKASGKIAKQEISTESFTNMIMIQPNNCESFYAKYPLVFIYACSVFIGFIIILKIFLLKSNKKNLI